MFSFRVVRQVHGFWLLASYLTAICGMVAVSLAQGPGQWLGGRRALELVTQRSFLSTTNLTWSLARSRAPAGTWSWDYSPRFFFRLYSDSFRSPVQTSLGCLRRPNTEASNHKRCPWPKSGGHWTLPRRIRETSYLRHTLEKFNLPANQSKSSAIIQKVINKLTTRNQPLTTRNKQACRKLSKFRREAGKGCARKHVKCIALQHNHSISPFCLH